MRSCEEGAAYMITFSVPNLRRRRGGLLGRFVAGRSAAAPPPQPRQLPEPGSDRGVPGRSVPDEPAKSAPPVESGIAAASGAQLDAAAGSGAIVWVPGSRQQAESNRAAWIAGVAPDSSPEPDQWLAAEAEPMGADAVRAYCAELLSTPHSGRVADEILAATDLASTPADELLQVTARLAAEHASAMLLRPGWRGRRSAKHVNCHSTPGWLASRAGGDLGGVEQEELEEHLRSCLPCQAAELRAARAERAFATALAGVGVGVRESSGPPNVGVGEGSAPPSVDMGETLDP